MKMDSTLENQHFSSIFPLAQGGEYISKGPPSRSDSLFESHTPSTSSSPPTPPDNQEESSSPPTKTHTPSTSSPRQLDFSNQHPFAGSPDHPATLSPPTLPNPKAARNRHNPDSTNPASRRTITPRPRPGIDLSRAATFYRAATFHREHERNPFGTPSELALLAQTPTPTSAPNPTNNKTARNKVDAAARAEHPALSEILAPEQDGAVELAPLERVAVRHVNPSEHVSTAVMEGHAQSDGGLQPTTMATTDWLREREAAVAAPSPAFLKKGDGLPPPTTAAVPKRSLLGRAKRMRFPGLRLPCMPTIRLPAFWRRKRGGEDTRRLLWRQRGSDSGVRIERRSDPESSYRTWRGFFVIRTVLLVVFAGAFVAALAYKVVSSREENAPTRSVLGEGYIGH